MSKHLLLISLGPVQDFIASARRCQDLWFGSWLLSDLARATAEEVQCQVPGEQPLIFPAGLERDDKPAVANKILSILPEGKEPQEVAEAARNAMQSRLQAVAGAAYSRVAARYLRKDLAEAQLGDLMELLWVAVPFGDEHEYAEARSQAESLLSARKNTRDWQAVPWHELGGAGVPKSSLDGQRESVIDEAAYNDLKDNPEKLRKLYFVKPGERLCGVGLLKRIGADPEFDEDGELLSRLRRPVFHSTSHVASAPVLTRIARAGNAGRNTLATYLHELRDLGVELDRFRIRSGGEARIRDPLAAADARQEIRPPRTYGVRENESLDGCLLFEGRLSELLTEYCPGAGKAPDPAKLERAKAALLSFRKSLGLRENHTTYYAYLLADGDAMGKAIDALAALENGIEKHRELGKAMEDFSAKCSSLVESAGGSLVYAGGDDVLALCPLHTALALARQLRDGFAEFVAPVFQGQGDRLRAIPDFKVPTLSVGLGVSHHLESMETARALARQAERAAKDAGRNALAVVVSKRSGGTIEVVRQWSDGAESLDHWLVELCGWLDRGELPDGLAFELERLVAPFELSFREAPNPQQVGAAVLALAQGIIRRKRAKEGNKDLPPLLVQRLQDALASTDRLAAVSTLSEEIQVARLFLGVFRDAFGELPAQGGAA